MKSGFVSIIGRPNVGKSTLLNRLIGKKISIVTDKSQTTRETIRGIYNDEDSQIVFLDTPGIHKPQSDLGVAMDKVSYQTIRTSDLALFIIDSSVEFGAGDEYLCEHVKFDVPLLLIYNKIDLTNAVLIGKLKERYASYFPDANYVEIAAKDGFGVDDLLVKVKDILPEGETYFPKDIATDRDLNKTIEDFIREWCLLSLHQEVPHGVYVKCDEVHPNGHDFEIAATIIVEKESQKGILIGKRGSMIKKIGTKAREEIEKYVGKHVRLDLVVRVVENWRNSSDFLVKNGYKI
jgi:GTP-binding protein Era